MSFQLEFYRLQEFAKECNRAPRFSHLSESLGRAEKFSCAMNEILHKMALYITLSSIQKEQEQNMAHKVKGITLNRLIKLLNECEPTQSIFLAMNHILDKSEGVFYDDIKKSAIFFTRVFDLKSGDIAQVLFNSIELKLKADQTKGVFLFDQSIEMLQKKISEMYAREIDPIINELIKNPIYLFSREDSQRLSQTSFELIRKHPALTKLFLLGKIEITEALVDRTLQATQSMDEATLNTLIQSAESTQKNIGLEKYRVLIENCYRQEHIDLIHLPVIIEAANRIGGKAEKAFSSFIELLRSHMWATISPQLPDLFWRALDESTVPIPNEAVFDSYSTPSDEMLERFMPKKDALQNAINLFEAVDTIGKELISHDLSKLQAQLTGALTDLREGITVKGDPRVLIWGILREIARRELGILPYSTQMINAILMANASTQKIIAQIKTGEGKSLLQALLMAYRALTSGKKQFNVTTSVLLVGRDAKKFTPFYKQLNLTCSVNTSANPKLSNLYSIPYSYRGHIVYGTANNFQFAYLVSLRDSSLRQVFQPAQTDIYIDEVDALIIDQEQSQSIMSAPSSITSKFFSDIWQYIFDRREGGHNLEDFRNYLIGLNYFTAETINQRISLYYTHKYYESAVASLSLEREKHYGIVDSKITIIDHGGTGTYQFGRQWSHGLHGIISAREGLTSFREGISQKSISHQSFFNLFSGLFAVTGTMGGEPCEKYLRHMYPNIEIVNLPRYRPSKAKKSEHVVCDTPADKNAQLLRDIQDIREKGRCGLFLFEFIRETQEFAAYAKEHGVHVSVLTGKEPELEIENTFALAGVAGSVLVATFLAGRGADITPSPDAESAGGLAVYVCVPPQNSRVMWQNFGRTGRQGRQGTYALRFSRNELLLHLDKMDYSINYAKDKYLPLPENREMNFPERPWEKPHQIGTVTAPGQEGAVQHCDASLRARNEEIRERTIARMERRCAQLDNQACLKIWHNMVDRCELYQNNMGMVFADYTHILFQFQRFIYEQCTIKLSTTMFETLHAENRYPFILNELNDAFRYKSPVALKRFIGDELLTLSKETPENLISIAEASGNNSIVECLKLTLPQAKQEAAQQPSLSANSMFRHQEAMETPPSPEGKRRHASP